MPAGPNVQLHNISDRDAVVFTRDALDRIPGGKLTLFENAKIKTGAPAREQPLDHIRATESNTKLEAWQSRLSHNKFRGADAKSVANEGFGFGHSFNS